MAGPTARENARSGPATTFAVRSGAEMPRFWGSSSPTIIEKTVAISRPRATASGRARSAETPSTQQRAARAGAASEGSTRKPTTSVVSVMPTWAPDSCVERFRTAASTPCARLSPASTARSTAGRSTLTSENSPATKTAVPRVRSTPRPTRSHSVTGWTSQVLDVTGARRGRPPGHGTPPSLPAPRSSCADHARARAIMHGGAPGGFTSRRAGGGPPRSRHRTGRRRRPARRTPAGWSHRCTCTRCARPT